MGVVYLSRVFAIGLRIVRKAKTKAASALVALRTSSSVPTGPVSKIAVCAMDSGIAQMGMTKRSIALWELGEVMEIGEAVVSVVKEQALGQLKSTS